MIDTDRYKSWEANGRRPLSDGVWHPDQCDKLRLRGVDFAVRPLHPPKGVRFRPEFLADPGEGGTGRKVTLHVDAGNAAPDVELLQLAATIRADAPIREGKACPSCGRPEGGSLEIDLDGHRAFLCTLVDYAARLLRKQYVLADEQIGELLAFSGESLPLWMAQVIRHACGLGGRGGLPAADRPTQSRRGLSGSAGPGEAGDELTPPAGSGPPGRSRTEFPWWRFWKR